MIDKQIVRDFKKSESAKRLKDSLKASSYTVITESDGIGSFKLTINYFISRTSILTIYMYFDVRNYNHSFDYIKHDNNTRLPLDFLIHVSDYFNYIVRTYKLFASKCEECSHLKLNDKNPYAHEYECALGKQVRLGHFNSTCISFDKRNGRIGEITESYLQAVNLFGEDFVKIKSS